MPTATAIRRTEQDRPVSKPVNILESIKNFRTIRPISQSEIPVRRGRNKSSMHDLEVVRDFNALLDHINKNSLNPSEVKGEIMLDTPEIQAERQKRKSFPQSFRKFLRQQLKEHGLSEYLDVVEFNKGERIFVVGRSA